MAAYLKLKISKPTLFASIRNRALNYLTHLKIRNDYQEKILQQGDITGLLTWEYYVEAELRQHIETAINHLPPQARKIFLMSRFDHKTAATIAVGIGVIPRTVENTSKSPENAEKRTGRLFACQSVALVTLLIPGKWYC